MKDNVCPNKNEMDEFIYLKTSILRLELSKLNLYVGQPIILEIISSNPGLTQKNLSTIAGIKPSTVNVMLGRLAKNDLVEIKKDENNSKYSKVFTTKKGEELANKAREVKIELDLLSYEGLTEEEKNNFKEVLIKVNSNLRKKLEMEEESSECI